MKKTARVSVLAGLLLAPALLTEIPEVAAQQKTQVIPYNVVSVNISDLRLQDVQALNEKTAVANYDVYEDLIDSLESRGTISTDEYDLLFAKIEYLREIQDLQSRTAKFKSDVSVLTENNATLVTEVKRLGEEVTAIEKAITLARLNLDEVIDDAMENADSQLAAFISASFAGMTDYTTAFPNYVAAYQLEASIKKLKDLSDHTALARSFIETYITGTGQLANLDTVTDPTEFRKKMQVLNEAYKEKLTATVQKIVNAHKPNGSTRTVGEMMKAANDDLKAADALNAAVQAIPTKAFKTGVTLQSELTKHQTTFNKMNARQKAVADLYTPQINGKLTRYDKALAVMLEIDALKPAATEEYHKAVEAAQKSYDGLANDQLSQTLVKNGNYIKLQEAVAATANSVAVIDEIKGIKTAADIIAARTNYTKLDSAAKKVVYNYKELQNWEKIQKSSASMETTIDKLEITNTKGFGTSVASAYKKYEVIDGEKRLLVTNGYRMEYLKPFGDAVTAFYALKLTAADYKTKVEELDKLLSSTGAGGTASKLFDELIDKAKEKAATTNKYTKDEEKLRALLKDLTDQIAAKKQQIADAEAVETLIDKAKDDKKELADLEAKYTAILNARAEYTKLGESSKDSQKLVKNLKTLTDLEKVVKKPADVIKQLVAVDLTAPNVASKAKTAVSAYEKLSETEKKYIPATYINLALDLKTLVEFDDLMKSLKPTNADFETTLTKAREKYDALIAANSDKWKSEDTETVKKMVEQIKKYDKQLSTSEENNEAVKKVVERINKLAQIINPIDFINEINSIESAYNQLANDFKKQVKNSNDFKNMKKNVESALKVVDLINQDVIKAADVSNSNYTKRFSAALSAYEKLSGAQKSYVYNYTSGLKPYIKVYELVEALNKLKPTANTYINDLERVRMMYNQLTATEKRYVESLLPRLTNAESGVQDVKHVMNLIEAAKPGVENYVEKLIEAREAYDALAVKDKSFQKLVANYKTLTDREKQLKPVMTVIHQIKELEEILARPRFDEADFVKKYSAAIQGYDKVDYEARELIYNREVLFTGVYPVAQTISAIDKIKPNSATFASEVKEARAWYESLSEAERPRVTNYNKLVAYEQTVGAGNWVDQLITEIASKLPSQYMAAVKEARAAYEALTAEQKKAVTRYKELQNYEKGIKNVQAAIDAIDNLQFASDLVKGYDKATAALDKLTAEERQMIPNMSKLQSVAPAIEVYKMIAALKPSNANFTGAVQAAFAAYNTLSPAEKQYVTNFAALQEAKNGIDTVQEVIAKIAAISPASRDYAAQVAEAMALYNSLPAAMKKQVTNYDILKASQAEASAVDKVKQMISEINPNASNFSTKVKAARAAYDKLSTAQKRLVGNYFLLEEYEAQLNDFSFFF